MATYLNNLRLKEIATGDESGTWGTSTNTNLELITDGFSYGTKQMAADANETFTMPDATADDTRSFYLKITSAVSLTATRVVTLAPNTVSKVWMIENATSGSQIITIKQGSGATVNVPNGSKVMVVTDGAGAGAAVFNANPTEVGGSVTSVGGTGTVNGITLTGTVTSSGNLTLGGALTGVDLTSQVTGNLPLANGGTGASLTDPDADRIFFWDDSAGSTAFLTVGSGLQISGTTLSSTDAGGTVTSVGGTGTVSGITLSGTVTSSGNLTLGGSVSINNSNWSGTDLSLANGGTGASLTDPNADRIFFWDDSAGSTTFLTVGSGLEISGTTLSATSAGGTVTSVAVSGGTTGLTTSGGPITGSGTITLAGTLAVANGGTGTTTSTGSGSVVLSTAPTFAGLTTTAGLYVGGTAAANLLDDYEEGSWTPIFSPQSGSFSAITMTNFISSPPRYTKVGNLVSIDATIETFTLEAGTGSGSVYLSGLPFAASNAATGSISGVTGFAGEEPLSVYVESSPTSLYIVYRSSVSGPDSLLQVSDLTTGTSLPSYRNYFILSITYRTTA